ncbi:hypothetical protein H4S02_003158 [Coemansia sp. RSA 2611]|nr:hypothetical protein H4S02_003158 [Coemansia sp. RSA 2611]
MSSKILSGRRKVYPAKAVPVVIQDYELTFDMRGVPYIEPGFGTISAVNRADKKTRCGPVGSPLHCVAFQITERELQHIVNTEGGNGHENFGYKLISIECQTYQGEWLVGQTLVDTSSTVSGLHPSPRYHNILLEGAAEHQLDPEYIERLSAVKPFVARTTGQKAAKYLMLVLFFPLFIPTLAFALAALKFDVQTPRIMTVYSEFVKQLMWAAHDWVLAPLFGKGD